MKKELHILTIIGYCKNCFRPRRKGSAFCGKCKNEKPRMKIYIDDHKNFPLLKEARKKFKTDDKTIFTMGDTIYSNTILSFDLIAHEITHVFQQEKTGAKKWWDKYFKDKRFRLEQEVEAYKRQVQVMRNARGEERAMELLSAVARDLSGELYNNIVDFETAYKLIK